MSGYLVEVPEEMVTKGACRGATGQVSWAEAGAPEETAGPVGRGLVPPVCQPCGQWSGPLSCKRIGELLRAAQGGRMSQI